MPKTCNPSHRPDQLTVPERFTCRSPHLMLFLASLVLGFWAIGCQPKPVTKARMYLQNSEWDLALEELKRAVEDYPENEEAHFLLGFVYGQNASYAEMTKRFNSSLGISNRFEQEIIAERNRHWKENYNNGIKAADVNDFQTAERYLKLAMLIDSTRYDAHKKLALNYRENDRRRDALQIFSELLQVYPEDVQLLLAVADVYLEENQLSEQVTYLRKIIDIEPDNRDALSKLAESLDVLNKSGEAEQIYRKAVTRFSHDRVLISRFGVHHFKKGNYEKAIELFQRVLELNPDDLEATSNVGSSYLSLAENLRRQLKKASNGSRRTADMQKMRDRALLNYKRSIPYLEKALELQPNLPKLWRNLGVAYIQTGEKQKGQEAFLKSDDLKIQQSK